jgi:hypothetical protein
MIVRSSSRDIKSKNSNDFIIELPEGTYEINTINLSNSINNINDKNNHKISVTNAQTGINQNLDLYIYPGQYNGTELATCLESQINKIIKKSLDSLTAVYYETSIKYTDTKLNKKYFDIIYHSSSKKIEIIRLAEMRITSIKSLIDKGDILGNITNDINSDNLISETTVKLDNILELGIIIKNEKKEVLGDYSSSDGLLFTYYLKLSSDMKNYEIIHSSRKSVFTLNKKQKINISVISMNNNKLIDLENDWSLVFK